MKVIKTNSEWIRHKKWAILTIGKYADFQDYGLGRVSYFRKGSLVFVGENVNSQLYVAVFETQIMSSENKIFGLN